MKHFSHSKKFISLLLSVAVAMTMTLSTVMTPLAAASVSDLRQKLQEQQAALEKVNQQLKEHRATKRTRSRSKHSWSSKNHCCSARSAH